MAARMNISAKSRGVCGSRRLGEETMQETPFDRLNRAFDVPQTAPPKPFRGKKQFALGRNKAPGTMNKTEARYERDVLAPLKAAGIVGWYAFEAVTLKLAPRCHYRIDFAVLAEDGVLEMVDVKGSRFMAEEDAVVKIKLAAVLFPFRFVMTWPGKKGEGWQREVFGE